MEGMIAIRDSLRAQMRLERSDEEGRPGFLNSSQKGG
jgi:hypothetical protein